MFLLPVAGSPFSTSEPSIEPEGQGSGGTEENYHRNMSWLHVCAFSMCGSVCVHVVLVFSFLHTDSPPPFYSLSAQIMILLCNQQSFICTHIDFCHPRCYQHHSRSCARLVRAIKLVYGETVDSLREDSASSGNIGARAKKSKEVGFNNYPSNHLVLNISAVVYESVCAFSVQTSLA